MKKCIVVFSLALVLLVVGCSSRSDQGNKNELNDETMSAFNVESALFTGKYVPVSADYMEYDTPQEIVYAATDVYSGVVEDITFEIIDMKTGKVDNSLESQSTSRMLYTIYTISVKSCFKGETLSGTKICRIGGLIGYNEELQYSKMQSSGLIGEYSGIPVTSEGVTLDIGTEYLFCTYRPFSGFDFCINLSQFAHPMSSAQATQIMELFE